MTLEPTFIDLTSAKVKCQYKDTAPWGGTCGIEYWEDTNINDSRKLYFDSTFEEIEIPLNGLKRDTEYQYRAFIKVENQYYWAEDTQSFKTKAKEISIATGEFTDITETTATLNGSVENYDKADKSIKFAFLYSTSEDICNSSDKRIVEASCDDNGNLIANLSDLTDYTTYYYAAAYRQGDSGYVLGDIRSFKTTAEVTTLENPAVTACSATLQGTCPKGTYRAGFYVRKDGTDEYEQYHANVDADGNFSMLVYGLEAETKYYYHAFAYLDGYVNGAEYSFTTLPIQLCPDDHHPHVIDLGLPSGRKWACCNVGTAEPEGFGGYYAWGETEEKTVYSIETYQHKYNYVYHENGTVTVDYVDLGDISGTSNDVARKKWGSSWRMPAMEDYDELFSNSDVEFHTLNGITGWLFKSHHGGCVFFPHTGWKSSSAHWMEPSELVWANEYGRYWCSDQKPDNVSQSWILSLDRPHLCAGTGYLTRFIGCTVRAVK